MWENYKIIRNSEKLYEKFWEKFSGITLTNPSNPWSFKTT